MSDTTVRDAAARDDDGSAPVTRHRFFAACPLNVSDLLAQELRQQGIEVEREHPAGVSFFGPLASAYTACLRSRTASRVLLTLADLDASDPDFMYRGLLTLPWETHVTPAGTFAVDVVGESPRWLRHTQFAALRAKDAIVDRMREHAGDRPSVDLAAPDLRVSLRFARERVTVGHRPERRAAAPARLSAVGRRGATQGKPGGGIAVARGLAGAGGAGRCVLRPDVRIGHAGDRGGDDRGRHRARPGCAAASASSAGGSTTPSCGRDCAARPRPSVDSMCSTAAAAPAAIATRRRCVRRSPMPTAPASAITCCSNGGTSPNLAVTTHAAGLVLVNPPYGVRIGDPGQTRGAVRDPRRAAAALLSGLGGGHLHRRAAPRARARAACLSAAHVLQRPDRGPAAALPPGRVREGARSGRGACQPARGGAAASRVVDVRQSPAQESRQARGLGAAQRRRLLSRLRRGHARVRVCHRPVRQRRALGLRAGVRGAAEHRTRSRARPARRGAGGHSGGARHRAGADGAARAQAAEGRRAVRKARRRGANSTSCAKAAIACW